MIAEDVTWDALERLAWSIRGKYCEARRRFYVLQGRPPIHCSVSEEHPEWDGGMDNWERVHEPIWESIVIVMVRHQIPAEDLVHEIFHPQNACGEPPPPTALMGEDVVERCVATRNRRAEDLWASLFSQRESLKDNACYMGDRFGFDRLTALGKAIAAGACEFDHLFRYCMACRLGLQDLADPHADKALAIYVCQRDAYDAIWGKLIPTDLREAAKTITARYEDLPDEPSVAP
jgi:hypothetical protein